MMSQKTDVDLWSRRVENQAPFQVKPWPEKVSVVAFPFQCAQVS